MLLETELLYPPMPPNRSGGRCRELWCTLLFAIGMQERHRSSAICTQQSRPMNHIYGPCLACHPASNLCKHAQSFQQATLSKPAARMVAHLGGSLRLAHSLCGSSPGCIGEDCLETASAVPEGLLCWGLQLQLGGGWRQPGRMGLDQPALIVWEVILCAVTQGALSCKAAHRLIVASAGTASQLL